MPGTTAASGTSLVASGGLLGAELSANGEWLLFDRAVAAGPGVYNSKLYLWQRGRGVREVGRGVAGAVSDDGQAIAYTCAEYVLCLKRAGQPVRRLSIRCPFSPPVVDVAGDLKSLILECSSSSSAATHTLVRIGPTSTTAERLPGQSLLLRGLSTHGTTAVLEAANRSVEMYQHGHLKVVRGISELGGVSSNGRFAIGSSTQRVIQTCPNEDPTKELGFEAGQPVIADLQSGRQLQAPASYLCLGRAMAVSDDGRFLIYGNRLRENCPTCVALVLVNVRTGRTRTLATNPGLEYGNVQFGANGTMSWVRGSFPQALFVSAYPGT